MAGGFMKERKDKAALSQTAKLEARREERELEESKAVVAQLRKELASAKDRKDDTWNKGDKQQIKVLEKEVKDEKKKIVRLEEEAVELKAAQEKLQIQLVEVQKKVDLHSPEGLAAAQAEHQAAHQDLVSKLSDKNHELKLSRDRVSALEKCVRHLDQEKRALDYEKGVLLEENEDLKGELEDLKESSRVDAEEAEEARKEAAKQLRLAKGQVKKDQQKTSDGPGAEELRIAVAERNEAQKEAETAFKELRTAKIAMKTAVAEATAAKEEARKAKEAAEASKSGVISTDVTSTHDELREELATAKKQCANILARYKSNNELYNQTVKEATTREYQSKSTIDTLRAEVRSMRSDLSNETSNLKATVKSLNEQRAAATQSLARKTTELANLQDAQDAALNAVRSQVSKSDSKVAELQRALEMAHASNKKPDQHKIKIAQLESTIAELTPRIATLTSRNAELDEALSFKQNELLAVQNSQKTYIDSLEAEPDTLQHHLRHDVLKEEPSAPGWAEPSVAQWKDKVSKLEEELAASKSANARLAQDSKKLEQYKSKLSPLEASYKSLKTDNSTLARDLSLKSNELTLVQSSNSTHITSVESELSNSVAGLSALLSKNTLLEDKIAEQEGRIKELLKGPEPVRVEKGEREREKVEREPREKELKEAKEALGVAREQLRAVKAELGVAKKELGEAKEEVRKGGKKLEEEALRRIEGEKAASELLATLEEKMEVLLMATAEAGKRVAAMERRNEGTESQGLIEAAKPLLALPSPPTPLLALPSPPTATPQPSPVIATTPTPAQAFSTHNPTHAALVQHSDFVFKQFVTTVKELNEANTTLRNSNTSLLMRLVGVRF